MLFFYIRKRKTHPAQPDCLPEDGWFSLKEWTHRTAKLFEATGVFQHLKKTHRQKIQN
jgi:hypothetical protein